MSGLEVNKILASIILAIIVVVIISIIGNTIVKTNRIGISTIFDSRPKAIPSTCG